MSHPDEDLVRFLRLRVEEDRCRAAERDDARLAREVRVRDWTFDTHDELVAKAARSDDPIDRAVAASGAGMLALVIAAIASIYADHPDYRPEWRSLFEQAND